MIQVSKSTLGKFSTEAYSMASMMDLLGSQPHRMSGLVRMKKAHGYGLMAITEGVGNVWEKDLSEGKRFEEIDSLAFSWRIETSQIPTVRLARENTETGVGGTPFVLYAQDKYFGRHDVIALENTQLLWVTEVPERDIDNHYKLTVVSLNGDAIDTSFTKQNSTLRWSHRLSTEYSEQVTSKHHYNEETHIEHMMKFRTTERYSQDFKANQEKYFMKPEDAKYMKDNKAYPNDFKIFKMSSIEEKAIEDFKIMCNNGLLFNKSTMDKKTLRSRIQSGNGDDLIAGNGLIPQYEQYAQFIDYSRDALNVKHFQMAIENIGDKRGMSQGNHITVLCNRRFSRQKADALENGINTFAKTNDGTWFYSRDMSDIENGDDVTALPARFKAKKLPQSVVVGATLNTYVYEGNTITFIIDEALTNRYPDRGYALFLDTGLYEDEKGQTPAVSLVQLKGLGMVKNHVAGLGGIDGRSNGLVSTAADSGSFEIKGWKGVQVKNPYAATIFVENF